MSSMRLNLGGLDRREFDGRIGGETVQKYHEARAGSCGGWNEERFETALSGQVPDLLSQDPVGGNEMLGPDAQPSENGVIREIQNPLQLDFYGCQHERIQGPPGSRLVDFGSANGVLFTTIERSKGPLRVVATAVKFAAFGFQDLLLEVPRDKPVKPAPKRSGG